MVERGKFMPEGADDQELYDGGHEVQFTDSSDEGETLAYSLQQAQEAREAGEVDALREAEQGRRDEELEMDADAFLSQFGFDEDGNPIDGNVDDFDK